MGFNKARLLMCAAVLAAPRRSRLLAGIQYAAGDLAADDSPSAK